MEMLIVDKSSGWTFQFNSIGWKTLSELRERIIFSLNLRQMPEWTSEDLDILMTRIDRVQHKIYKEGSGHCDRFDVYAVIMKWEA